MMHDDAYRARALALATLASSPGPRLSRYKLYYSTKDRQTGSHYQYAVTLHREESADASWPSLPTNQTHYDMQRTD